MLQTTIDGQQHTARAWVAVPELLEAQVTSRARQRWEGHLVSDDPTIQAEGIAALLDQILRDLSRGGEEETAASGSVRPHTESHREESRRFRSALEVFQFSPDSDRIRLTAASLLESPSLDPLAVLRALIARMASVAPLAKQADEYGLDRYERLRHAATRRLGESLARHLELLASRDRDWARTTEPKIAACLEGTFGATTLIWYCEVGREASVQLRTRLAEGFVALLERVSAARQAAPHLRELRIAGPLAPSLGAMAQAASDDPFLTDRLRRLGRAILGDDPRPTLRDWRATCQRQAAVLFSSSQDSDPLSRWEPHALRLFGFAPGHVKNRLEQQWDLLLELQEADRANSSRREDLYRAAEARYQGSTIWARYLSARRGGRLPAISLVSRPQCDRCFASLPSQRHDCGVAVTQLCAIVDESSCYAANAVSRLVPRQPWIDG